ncbi:MAG: hypothetical protein SGJ15_08100 [Bacteroidota bacterium]|nr:hypothetical protein [Bacteroidota bacterium]
MDKELSDILKKANKDNKEEEQAPPPKVFPPNEPYDYLVFTQLTRFSGFQKLIFLIIIPGGISTLFFFENMSATAVMCLSIYGGLLLLYLIINFLRFKKFNGWQERLPFVLNGFSEMIRTKKMFCDLCWNHTKITVEQNGNDMEIQKVIEAALKLFCKRSEMAFYTQKTGSSSKRSRNDWKFTSALCVEGSANPEVMRYMKDLFEKEFTVIAKKTNAIKSVKIELFSEEFEVRIQIDSGD